MKESGTISGVDLTPRTFEGSTVEKIQSLQWLSLAPQTFALGNLLTEKKHLEEWALALVSVMEL